MDATGAMYSAGYAQRSTTDLAHPFTAAGQQGSRFDSVCLFFTLPLLLR